jgi:hypothetical protein
MKLSVVVVIGIVFTAMNCNAQQNFQPIPDPPGKYEITHMDLRQGAGRLDELIRISDLIIFGKVNEVLPSVRRNLSSPKSLSTFSHIFVNKVLKGELPKDQNIVAISEPGGNLAGYEVVYSQHPLVKLHEHYIFFLKNLSVNGEYEVNLGVPLFTIVGNWAGRPQIIEDKIQFLPASSANLHTYDGMEVGEFFKTIQKGIDFLNRSQLPIFLEGDPKPFPKGGKLPPFGLPQQ